MTDPIDFERPSNTPPAFVTERAPKLQMGEITYMNSSAASFSMRVRDPDVTQDLEIRWRIRTSNDVPPSQTIPLPAANGALIRDVTINVQSTQLRRNQCHRVEVAVSSEFHELASSTDNARLFLLTVDPDDIALFTFWIWEGDPSRNDPEKLVETCPPSTFMPPAVSIAGEGGAGGVGGDN